MLKTEVVEYRDGDAVLEGICAYEDETENKPVVMIVHDWSGRNELTQKKALELASFGYIGFAIDMFGKGKSGKTKEEKSALIAPFVQDRAKLLQRMEAAFTTAQKLSTADPSRIAVMGYCFGGLCALDLARGGAALKGAVSLHGLLSPPEGLAKHEIKAKVLALHGFDDPMVTPDQVTRFGEEMTHASVDWQFVIYGNTMHAFTNPLANDPGFGTVYNESADRRSWIAVCEFFKEIFAT